MKLVVAVIFSIALLIPARSQTIVHPDYFIEVAASGLVEPTSLAFVSPNGFLVTRKNLGRITYVLNGIAMGTALDVAVASDGEQGMLGVALDPQFSTNSRVYVYYSKAAIDGGAWEDDRIERYIWNGANLVFDSVIATWPFDPSQGNSIYHHGGILRVGPDNKLYIQRGDLGRNVRIELNNHTTLSANAAVINRLELDGTIPSDNPFVTDPNLGLKQTYVYGFRNGFGMDFDPVTGKLWFSENGPEVYDELNIAVSGMNSGWRKIMGPDSRDALFAANGFVAQNAADLVYLPGATYVDPIFSWTSPIGVTGVCFLNSDKFGAQKNQVLVGNTNLGSLHLFQPNGARTGLVLSGGTADTVADNAAERDQFLFGTGLGLVTDIVMGLDGYAYACSISASAVYRIRPKTETIAPTTATPGPGQVLSGNTMSLAQSDDNKLVMRPTAVLVSTQPPVQLVVQGTSPFSNPTAITVRIESSASIASALQRISLYDWQAPGYVEVSSQLASISDNILIIPTTSSSRFVNSSDRMMRALITYKAQGAVLVYPWHARIDEFTWTVTK